jgi:hypothetical protein
MQDIAGAPAQGKLMRIFFLSAGNKFKKWDAKIAMPK